MLNRPDSRAEAAPPTIRPTWRSACLSLGLLSRYNNSKGNVHQEKFPKSMRNNHHGKIIKVVNTTCHGALKTSHVRARQNQPSDDLANPQNLTIVPAVEGWPGTPAAIAVAQASSMHAATIFIWFSLA
jgi:hypothetical protein